MPMSPLSYSIEFRARELKCPQLLLSPPAQTAQMERPQEVKGDSGPDGAVREGWGLTDVASRTGRGDSAQKSQIYGWARQLRSSSSTNHEISTEASHNFRKIL